MYIFNCREKTKIQYNLMKTSVFSILSSNYSFDDKHGIHDLYFGRNTSFMC